MADPHNKPEHAQPDIEFDRFDEAQPFLQLLADMLARMSDKSETDDTKEDMNQQEQAAG